MVRVGDSAELVLLKQLWWFSTWQEVSLSQFFIAPTSNYAEMTENVLELLAETRLSEGSLQMIWQGAHYSRYLHSGPLINI